MIVIVEARERCYSELRRLCGLLPAGLEEHDERTLDTVLVHPFGSMNLSMETEVAQNV